MNNKQLKKMILTAIFAGIAVVGSTFSFPIMGAKCAPVQHLINVLSAVILGPVYALGQAFVASLIRNLAGLGSLLAFPGSMFGAALAGVLYKYRKNLWSAYIGEVFGTAIIGGLVAYPIALLIMGNSKVALTTFIVPFLISTAGGTIIAWLVLSYLEKSGMLERMKKQLGS